MPDASDPARARYARVQAAMARRGVGALLLATPHAAAFASGARRVQVAGSGGSVPWVAVAAGAPSALVFTTDPDGAPPWMPRAAVEPLRWDPDAQLARLGALVAATDGAVACDVVAPALAALLAAAAPGRPVIDAAPLLAEAAGPLTDAEVAAIAAALAAARRAVAAAAEAVRPGVALTAVLARAARTMSTGGARFPLAEGFLWRARRRLERLAPTDTVDAGETLAFELGVVVAGHAGVAGTSVALGGGAEAAALRRAWADAAEALAAHCRTGATTADLREAARAAGAGQADLLAHGLGVGVLPPWVDLDGDDATPLRAGTVLVLAPVVASGRRAHRATRALFVGDGAARWLEAAP
ncbi:MAG TPA: M24 family metallopeptidase [Candidatus Binatia bacterium]|nr:M24 family metallopeptidase [Candidatus Binatia bacterium]